MSNSNASPAGVKPEPPALTTALHLLELDLWPVAIVPFDPPFPGAKNPGKQPVSLAGRLTGWGTDRPTRGALESFYAAHPTAGVGLKLGPDGGIIDVEVDSAEGYDTLLELFDGEIPETMGWQSSKGPHYIFKWDDRFAEFKSVAENSPAFPGIGVRLGQGTKQVQSVCPPSPTSVIVEGKPTPGEAREWIEGSFGNILPLPDHVIDKLRASFDAGEPARRGSQPGGSLAPAVAGIGYGPTSLAGELVKLRATKEGGRNDQLNKSAFKMGQLIPHEITDETARMALLAAGEQIGLGRSEVEATVRSGLEKGKLEPRKIEHRKRADPMFGSDALTIEREPSPYPKLAEGTVPRNQSDMGNAERLEDRHGDDIRFCHKWGEWLIWDGKRWARDEIGRIRELAKDTVRSIYDEASHEGDDAARKPLAGHAIASEKRDRISAMIDLAKSRLPIRAEELNRDAWSFNVANGTIDLRTGDLREHRREDYNGQLCPVNFDPGAEAPLWLQTLHLFFAGNADLIAYFQRICGYAMVGEIRDHILPIAYGRGANGKSTILETLIKTFGPDYAMAAPPDLLMSRQGEAHPTEQADLFGKRLVIAIESEQDRKLNETLVKKLTGGDSVRARRMREDFWEFTPSHTLILATNHKPEISGTDLGIWRRVKFLPFNVTMDASQADTTVPERLKAEARGILAWCVRGCLAWQAGGLAEPTIVAEATREYRAEQDVIGTFIEARCFSDPSVKVRASVLYAAYLEWAKESGEKTLSLTKFGKAITERGIAKDKGKIVTYKGIDTIKCFNTDDRFS